MALCGRVRSGISVFNKLGFLASQRSTLQRSLIAPSNPLPSRNYANVPGQKDDKVKVSMARFGGSRSENEIKSDALRDRLIRNSRSENYAENGRSFNRELDTRPFFMRDREKINSKSENDAEAERSYRPMDFVRGVIDEDGKDFIQAYSRTQLEKDADFVHIKMLRNNTFVTVTDSNGNIKLSGSAGSVKEMKAGQKLSRYAAEATTEVVGRRARGLGLKAVVMKVNGFTHFRRKRQAIMSWLEGYCDSRGDRNRNPVVHIEDTTRKPHNGCRLPKKRRI